MSNFHKSGADEAKIIRGLVTVFLCFVAVAGAFLTMRSGNIFLIAAFLALPFVILLMHSPQTALALALILDASGIPLPGVSGGASPGLPLKILLIAVMGIGVMMHRKPWQGQKLPETKPLLCFTAVMILLMMVRGTGLRALGSSMWGGMIYIILLCNIGFYFAVNGLRISRKQIRWIVWGSLLAGVIGAALRLRGFEAVAEEGGVGASRLMWLSPIAGALFPLVFALKFRRTPWISGLLLLICLGLIGLTGFRSRLVGLVMVTAGYGFFKAKDKVQYALLLGGLGLAGWIGIVLISSHLPLGLQRAVSFVPGAHIDYRTAQDAAGSIEWRVEIWKYCLDRAKEYLLIGRGSAFNIWETAENVGVWDIQTFSPWFAFQTRSYHSGPLSLLVDYGLPGLLIALWLTVLVIKHVWGLARRLAGFDTFESRYALFLCVGLLWRWVAFYLVYGDMSGFANMVSSAAVAMVIAGSVFAVEHEKNERVALR
jgi:hypothetical protein